MVSNSNFVSVGVRSPTEINAPRGCAQLLSSYHITDRMSRNFPLSGFRLLYCTEFTVQKISLLFESGFTKAALYLLRDLRRTVFLTEICIDALCRTFIHSLRALKLLQRSIAHCLKGSEPAHQRLSSRRSNALDIIEDRMYLSPCFSDSCGTRWQTGVPHPESLSQA